ncbi:MAG: response regulator [Deltaproteobacteria bacterium]|nr:response regulator [Deltaproteobacteria bacterium]
MIVEKTRWLMHVEDAAQRFYGRAAELFYDDRELWETLKRLEADEKRHYAVVKAIYALSEEFKGLEISYSIDTESMAKTEARLRESEARLESGSMTKEQLLHAIVELEMSEHNDFLLYAANSVKGRLAGLITDALDFREHKGRIEGYVKAHPEFHAVLGKIALLPVAARENLLVVDDEEAMTEAFNTLLADHGIVDRASNGDEALRKIEAKWYAAIISDVRMPVMDGVELYKKAVERYPGIKDRFIFLTNYGEDNAAFFEKNNLRYLEKPASIRDIKRAISEVLHKAAL